MIDLDEWMIWEYDALVTQLAATSEVANIGFKVTPPVGEEMILVDFRLTESDQDAGIAWTLEKVQSSDNTIKTLASASPDNQYMQDQIAVSDGDTATVLDAVGKGITEYVGSGQYLNAVLNGTLDATTTLQLQMTVATKSEKVTVAAVGAGISISSETHLPV